MLAACIAAGAVVGSTLFSAGPDQRGSSTHHISLLNFTVTAKADAISYATTATQADATAFNALAQDSSGLQGYTLLDETLAPGLSQVADPTGTLWFDRNPAEDDFVLIYTAPPQQGYQYIAAVVLVKAQDDSVSGYQVRGSNDPNDVLPLPVVNTPCVACGRSTASTTTSATSSNRSSTASSSNAR